MTRRWQGTALFAVLIAGVATTVAGRLVIGGDAAVGTPGTSSSAAARSSGVSVTGAAEQTRFGTVQVAVTFDGSKITGVHVLQAPSESGRDQMLTEVATPQLEQEVIASQSARVDSVSGATYTSAGYLASVQSAIDAHK